MPIIDKPLLIRSAFRAATAIHRHADWLASQSGSIDFEALRDRMDAMRREFQTGAQPVLDLAGASAVNAEVATFFAGAPAQTYQALEALRASLIALYQAYDAIFGSITPITHTVAGGHDYASVPVSQINTLSDEVTAVRDAAAPLSL